jgi:hypothetical protein
MRGVVLGGCQEDDVKVLMCGLLALVVAGCAGERKAWVREDSWFRAPGRGNEILRTAATPVDWSDVRAAARGEAAARLEKEAVVELTPEEHARYVAGPLGDPGMRWFLVRGVYVNWRTGHFSVLTDGRDLLVLHRSFANRTGEMQRWPLVVALKERPGEVYSVAMVEGGDRG